MNLVSVTGVSWVGWGGRERALARDYGVGTCYRVPAEAPSFEAQDRFLARLRPSSGGEFVVALGGVGDEGFEIFSEEEAALEEGFGLFADAG